MTGTRAAGIVDTVGTSTVPTGMEAADVEAADVVFAPGADAVGMGTRDVVNGVTASVGSTVDALIGGLSLCRRWSRTPCTMPGPEGRHAELLGDERSDRHEVVEGGVPVLGSRASTKHQTGAGTRTTTMLSRQ